jgi:hypothetical protein
MPLLNFECHLISLDLRRKPTTFQPGGQSVQSILLCLSLLKLNIIHYRGADKSLARPGRKQATATEDFDFHISYL